MPFGARQRQPATRKTATIRMKPSKDVLLFWSYFLGLLGKVELGKNFLRGVGKLI
jgi:hypothetical protein